MDNTNNAYASGSGPSQLSQIMMKQVLEADAGQDMDIDIDGGSSSDSYAVGKYIIERLFNRIN